jgi:hypothetical protein
MKNSLALKLAVPVAVAVLGLLSAAPIGAQTTVPPQEVATLTVTKTVVGTAPADAEFTLHLSCSGTDDEEVTSQVTDYEEDITFGATGGSQDFEFTGPSLCEITETDDGGADSSSGPVEVAIEDPISYEAEIVNTFVAAETTTTAAAAAEAVEATAAFTG